jgi:hypothetical protein
MRDQHGRFCVHQHWTEKEEWVQPLKYPLDRLEVGGEPLWVSLDKAQAARQAACNYGQRHDRVFKSKRYGSQVKIWRAA